MITELCNQQGTSPDSVDHPVLVCNSTRPVSRENMLQRFRFARSFEGRSRSFLAVNSYLVPLTPIPPLNRFNIAENLRNGRSADSTADPSLSGNKQAHSHNTVTSYWRTNGSGVISTSFSTCACATNKRSKGSRCNIGNRSNCKICCRTRAKKSMP